MQTGERGLVPAEAEHRPHHEQLIERELPMKDMAAMKPVLCGKCRRSDDLRGKDEPPDSRSEPFERSQHAIEQDRLERRIFELEEMLKNVSIIQKPTGKSDEVTVGATIKVSKDGKEFTYQIVGSNETQPEAGKISNESSLGRAFLGKKAGDIAKITTPKGEVEYKIVAIL